MSSEEYLPRKRGRAQMHSTESTRERFLRELATYESDHDNDDNDDNDDCSDTSHYFSNNYNLAKSQVKGNHGNETSAFASMFDKELEEEEEYESFSEQGNRVQTPQATINMQGGTNKHEDESPNVALHVGRGLLQQMHHTNNHTQLTSPSVSHPVSAVATTLLPTEQELQTQLKTQSLQVVDAYVPLSTGGFLHNADAMESVANMKVGDVVCIRERTERIAKRTPLSNSSELSSLCKEVDNDNNNNHNTNDKSNKSCNNNVYEESEQASPTSRTFSSETMATVQEVAAAPLQKFKSESLLSSREREWGVEPTVAMMQRMAQITRLDKRKCEAEICFINEQRQKVSLFTLRPAGFVERKLFAQWRENPSSRPVPVIHATKQVDNETNRENCNITINRQESHKAHSSTTCDTNAKNNNDNNNNYKCEKKELLLIEQEQTPMEEKTQTETLPWWVIPKLIVRVVTEERGCEGWYGQKCRVLSIVRRESRIRLELCHEEINKHHKLCSSATVCDSDRKYNSPIVEVIGQEAIETVLPKRGENGIVVLGEHRGELVQVLSRNKDKDKDKDANSNEIRSITAMIIRSKEIVELAPHEVCKLVTQ